MGYRNADSDSPTFFTKEVMNLLAAAAISFKDQVDEVAASLHDAIQLVDWDTQAADVSELTFSNTEEKPLTTLVRVADEYGALKSYVGATDAQLLALTLASIDVVDFSQI